MSALAFHSRVLSLHPAALRRRQARPTGMRSGRRPGIAVQPQRASQRRLLKVRTGVGIPLARSRLFRSFRPVQYNNHTHSDTHVYTVQNHKQRRRCKGAARGSGGGGRQSALG